MDLRTEVRFRSTARSPLGGITAVGSYKDGRGLPWDSTRVLESYALVYLLGGEGRYRDARGTNLRLVTGDLILVFPRLPHTYAPEPGKTWSEFYMVFEGEVFELWETQGILDRDQPVMRLAETEYWLGRLRSVVRDDQGHSAATHLQEICRLQTVLSEMLAVGSPGVRHGPQSQWATRARKLLEADLRHGVVDFEEVAARLGLSYDAFRRRFSRSFGVSPFQYHSRRVIDRACEMVQQGDMSNREIAEQLNFCDEFYFSRRFKKLTGRSPTEFRRSLPRAGGS